MAIILLAQNQTIDTCVVLIPIVTKAYIYKACNKKGNFYIYINYFKLNPFAFGYIVTKTVHLVQISQQCKCFLIFIF